MGRGIGVGVLDSWLTYDPTISGHNLSNGFTVLTESKGFPGPVHMWFLINVGFRDETKETENNLWLGISLRDFPS